jgi:hypothetical protein
LACKSLQPQVRVLVQRERVDKAAHILVDQRTLTVPAKKTVCNDSELLSNTMTCRMMPGCPSKSLDLSVCQQQLCLWTSSLPLSYHITRC